MEECYRCGRHPSRPHYGHEGNVRRIVFCTWYCGHEWHRATGLAVYNDKFQEVIAASPVGELTPPPYPIPPPAPELNRVTSSV